MEISKDKRPFFIMLAVIAILLLLALSVVI